MKMRRLLCLAAILTLLRLGASTAAAHPVAQGAMEIVVRPEWVDIHARVSNEEAFVAEAFGENKDADTTLDAVWRRHGEYLLAHLHLTVDSAPVAGRIAGMTPPEKNTPEARVSYDLQFHLASNQTHPRTIELRQDVLNEIPFAPGNPWEASYVVRISQKDRTLYQGLLWTSRQPLAFTCDWSAFNAAVGKSLNAEKTATAGAFTWQGIMSALGSRRSLLFVAGLALASAGVWVGVKLRRSRSPVSLR
jgi:hypothetical protein